MDIARDAAAEALVSGEKSVETVQGFLLLAVYPIPQKKWSDNRSWLFMGAAIRYECLLFDIRVVALVSHSRLTFA